MRSMFLQHSPNLNCKIKEQIRYINQMVVDWATLEYYLKWNSMLDILISWDNY